MYYAPIATVPRLIESGRVRPVGTKRRMRALVALCDSEELLCASRPPSGWKCSHNRETNENPRGVWTFRRMSFADAA